MRRSPNGLSGFTFFEVLTVCVLIAILAGIGYPSIISILERARKTQAANEEQQIVTAVNAYYSEYGKYPLPAGTTADTTYGSGGISNSELFYTLRAVDGGTMNAGNAANPRKIVYIQPPISKTGTKGGINSTTGIWYDPWGSPYNVMIDGGYDNQLTPNPYIDAPGGTTLYLGVIVWSFGKNGVLGGGGATASGFTTESGTPNNFLNSGDVVSWQ
jgi:Tfp pilus assembly protein PilE